MASASIVNLKQDNWQSEVLEYRGTPVLVDFWAEWCGPCKAIAPVLEELSEEYDGQLKITKVNVDESPELAQQFQVRSIPTLLIFKEGEVAEQLVGAMSKAALKQKLEAHIS